MSDDQTKFNKRKRQQSSVAGNSSGDEKWSEELHRQFVSAVYDCGLRHSSPSVIIENMTMRPESLTSERVKSHLQKYRKNKDKSKSEFMDAYDSFMRKALTMGGVGGSSGSGQNHVILPPDAVFEMMGEKEGKPSGGEIAGFLSYSVMTEGSGSSSSNNSGNAGVSSLVIARESQDYLRNFAGTSVPFPQLTEEEKDSPLGLSMVYVMGLFSSMSQHMMNEREKQKRQKSNNDLPGGAYHVQAMMGNPEKAFTDHQNGPPNHSNRRGSPFENHLAVPGLGHQQQDVTQANQQSASNGHGYFHPVDQGSDDHIGESKTSNGNKSTEGYAQV